MSIPCRCRQNRILPKQASALKRATKTVSTQVSRCAEKGVSLSICWINLLLSSLILIDARRGKKFKRQTKPANQKRFNEPGPVSKMPDMAGLPNQVSLPSVLTIETLFKSSDSPISSIFTPPQTKKKSLPWVRHKPWTLNPEPKPPNPNWSHDSGH